MEERSPCVTVALPVDNGERHIILRAGPQASALITRRA
jgi:hypothetical protein